MKPFIIAGIEPVKVEPYNSNNAWGFGGMVGERMTYPNGAIIVAGKACYRHMPSHAWVNVYNSEGKKVFSDYRLSIDDACVVKAITEKGATDE